METTRYELHIDAFTDDAVSTLLHDARTAGVTFTNLVVTNGNDHGFPVVAFDATADAAARYVAYYDIDGLDLA